MNPWRWLGLLMLPAVTALAEGDVLALRLEKSARPVVTFSGSTQEAKERDLAVALQKQSPAFDPADPACRSLLWYMACWETGDLTTKADINAKYFDIGVANFNSCQELTALLAKTKLPVEFQTAWRTRHAYELIELRLHYDLAAEAKRLGGIPLDRAKLLRVSELSVPASLKPADAKRWLDWVAEINPGLDPGGNYVVPAGKINETAPHVVVPLAGGLARVFWYRLDPKLPVLVPAGPAPQMPDTTTEPSAKWSGTTVYRQVIAGKNGAPFQFYVTTDATGIRNAWAATPTIHNRAHRVTVHGKTLSVTVPPETVSVEFDARQAAKLDPAKPLTDSLRENWPWWRGPAGRNASERTDVTLVDDAEQAALAWVSDESLPMGRGPDTRGKQHRLTGQPLMGGWASPVVADNRVFQTYYVPSGTNYSLGVAKLIATDADREAYRIHLIDADDVVHCFDARTGRTLWKRVYPLAGLNYASFNKSGPQLTPCVAGNRLFAMGSAGRMYCLDVATGDTLWQTDIGRRAQIMENHRTYLKSTGQQYGARSDLNGALTPAGSVVVTCDYSWTKGGDKNFRYEIPNGLLAFDQQTGKVRWHLPGLGTAGAARWMHAGREYLVASTQSGVVALDPETGNQLWRIPQAGGPQCLPVSDDFLVCNTGEKKAATALACYRMTPQKAERLWELPAGTGYDNYVSPVIMDGHLYTGHKEFACIELATGKVKATLAKRPAGSLTGGSGHLFYWTDLGHARPDGAYAKADPAAFQAESWRIEVAGPYDTTLNFPVVDGRLIVRLIDRLACYDFRAAHAVTDRKHAPLQRREPLTVGPPGLD